MAKPRILLGSFPKLALWICKLKISIHEQIPLHIYVMQQNVILIFVYWRLTLCWSLTQIYRFMHVLFMPLVVVYTQGSICINKGWGIQYCTVAAWLSRQSLFRGPMASHSKSSDSLRNGITRRARPLWLPSSDPAQLHLLSTLSDTL